MSLARDRRKCLKLHSLGYSFETPLALILLGIDGMEISILYFRVYSVSRIVIYCSF